MEKKASNKEIIFKEAARLFSEQGYERTSMRAIAEAAGVSKPAIYYYFPNKDALFEEMLAAAMEQVQETLEKIQKSSLGTAEKLTEIAVSRFAMYLEHPELSKFLTDMAVWNIKKKIMLNFLKKHHGIHTIVNNIVAEGIETGLFRSEIDPNVAATMFLGGLNMYMVTHIKTGAGEMTSAKAREFVTNIIDGIRSSQG
ncbi:MAG: TetR/AcrR family transcriptional regulator [Candidatus Marinimicrobia bacterium]|nr:TetR/AcrR family transcriptional regulator [Candidatus Neomarinimicrobiota bacterium]